MGELSKADADSRRNQYISKIESVKKSVRENFEEMDFQNADARTRMEGCIESLEGEYNSLIQTLEGMIFE